ncbi:SDR family NAD(P)-dependent oxidoreductase [Dactylosporangium sp. NPDC051485]|uniref:SDR family NAD(P)-dependent oxidoreductase n=1 Tax=Dactylosporangium sp. NPDC051485 TaxID=3154846 RepID=UPI0034153E64
MSGAVIIGVGPGIGRSVALRFAREGLPIALVARTGAAVRAVAEAIAPLGVRVVPLTADSTDETALRAALDAAADELGPPDVVVYNAAIIQADSPGDLSVRAHQEAWAVNVVGAITAAAHLLPNMARRGNGSFLITGGMPEPKPQYVSLSLGKAGVRTLVALLDQEYGPSGVHVATVTVAGAVAPGTAFDPDDIAEHYWRLHSQPRQQWEQEIVHDEQTSAGGAPTDPARDVITALLDRWQAAFNAHQPDHLSSLFAQDALFQGITAQLLVGPAAIRGYYDKVAEGTTAEVEVLQGNLLRENIITGFADVTFTASTRETTQLRLSIVAKRSANTWSISHYHAAGLSASPTGG